jgi:hypothetical protein
MKFEVCYNNEYKDYFIFWNHNYDCDNKEIRNWCRDTFPKDWVDGIEDLHYIRVKSKKYVTAFLLRWS